MWILRGGVLAGTAAVLMSLAVGAAVYLWQRTEVRETSGEAAQLERLVKSQRRAMNALTGRVDSLTAELSRTAKQLRDLRRAVATQSAPSIPDGRHFGYVDALIERPRHLVFDLAQWFTGEEANVAAVQDGFIEEGDTVPNDYYVRNSNTMLRTVTISDEVEIILSTWDRKNIPVEKSVDFPTLARIFGSPKRWERGVLRSGYWITVSDGVITSIEEQYVP
jgi:hypothetical protein